MNFGQAELKNNKGFEIYHSIDGQNWKTIDFVKSKSDNGNSSTDINYFYAHTNPQQGTNFYQLNQVDFDGQSSLSKIIQAEFNAEVQNVSLYPNPNSGDFYLKNLPPQNEISIVDMKGRTVKTIVNQLSDIAISSQNLTSGVYWVMMSTNGNAQYAKLKRVVI